MNKAAELLRRDFRARGQHGLGDAAADVPCQSDKVLSARCGVVCHRRPTGETLCSDEAERCRSPLAGM